VLLARSLLRRAVYRGATSEGETDRLDARRLLDAVVATSPSTPPTPTSSAMRDACFMVAEAEVRAHAWARVSGLEAEVLRLSTTSLRADDPPYVAAAHARLAQAALALQSPVVARGALASAIDAGDACVPRAECVSVGASARAILPETWAILGAPARTMVPLLSDAALTAVERRGPLLRLADLYAAQSGASCAPASEEARGWADALR
jgi:hypothetical protein